MSDEGISRPLYFRRVNVNSPDDPQLLPPSFPDAGKGAGSGFTECPNCQTNFQPDWRYCPGCGQENRAVVVSFTTLVRDFLGDFFTFDSRFFRTIIPFFFKPGLLTSDYLKGHRVRFVGPIRILVFGCIVLFALLSRKINQQEWEIGDGTGSSPAIISFSNETDTAATVADSVLTLLADSLGAQLTEISDPSDSSNRNRRNLGHLLEQIPILADSLSPEEVADELVAGKSIWRKKFVVQSVKVYQSKGKNLVSYMIGNGTIIILMSVFMQSIFMRLLYIRRKHHLVEHFIFTTHTHAAIVYWSIIVLLVDWITGSYANWMVFLLMPYLYVSLLKVYQQGWLKTLFKYGLITATYLIIFLPILTVTALVVSFLFI